MSDAKQDRISDADLDECFADLREVWEGLIGIAMGAPGARAVLAPRQKLPAIIGMVFAQAKVPVSETRRPSGIDSILDELERAVAKFPTWPTDPLHAIAVLGEEFGELTKAMLQLTYEPHKSSAEDVRTEALQTAAMALRLYRSLDKYEYVRGEQHDQAA
jgi:hypothetical protein